MKIKIFGLGIPIDWVIKLLIQALEQVIDKLIPGETLSRDQKKVVRTAYYLGKDWGQDAVEDTETDLDDAALGMLLNKCEDTAQEGSFNLPVVPELN